MSNGKKLTKRRIEKKNNDCFWMENIFCLESHIHLCSRHTSAIPAYVIKTCVTWHAISGTRYRGFVSPKLHVSTYRNQQHCWWFQYEQFSLQPAHPCFKIHHVGSSGKFPYMFPVYMVITSENKKIIRKVVFKILTFFAKIRALFRHLFGRNADIW